MRGRDVGRYASLALIGLALMVVPLAAVAAEEPFRSPQVDRLSLTVPAGACRGDTVRVVVNAQNTVELKGYGINLCFDAAVFDCVGGPILQGTRGEGAAFFVPSCADGCASAGVVFSITCPGIPPGEGPFLFVDLRVKDDAPAGPATIDLRDEPPSNNRFTDCAGGTIVPELVDAALQVVGIGPLIVTSDPAGSSIILDGQPSGFVTPHTFTDLGAGEHCVQWELAGYEGCPENCVTLVPCQSESLHCALSQSLPPPTLLLPADNSDCQPSSVLLDWTDVDDATGYKVRLGTGCGSGTEETTVASQFQWNNLQPATTYHWQVATRAASGTYGDYSGCFSFTTLPVPLSPPSLTSPPNAATCQSTATCLDWSDVGGAVSYVLRIGTSCGSGTETEGEASSACPPLQAGTTYYWQVAARDACGQLGSFSACRHFSTVPEPPDAPCCLRQPPNGSTCRPTSGTLDWDDEAGAASYIVQIGTSCGTGDEDPAAGSSFDYAGLLPGTTYYWRVRAVDSCSQQGPYSACNSFTTAPEPLDSPGLLSPPDASTCQDIAVTLDWADVPGAAEYRLRYGNACGAGQVVETASSTYALGGLSPGATYYWQVATLDACGTAGDYSACFSFITASSVAAPSHLEPDDGASCLTTTVTLDWADVPGATGYIYQIGTTCGTGPEVEVAASTAAVELAAAGTYHWRVKTKNDCGDVGAYGPCTDFTTRPAEPGIPALQAPVNGATCVLLDVTLDWSPVPCAVGYKVRIGSACGAGNEATTTDSEYTATLDPNTTYFWSVSATLDGSVYGSYSPCREFETGPARLAAPALLTPPDNQECIEPEDVILTWSSLPGAVSYDVQIGTACGAGDIQTTEDASYSPEGLDHDVAYSWRVRGVDSCGQNGMWSACGDFRTSPAVPVAPTLLEPEDGAMVEPENGSVELRWSPLESCTYRLQISRSALFDSVLVDIGELEQGSYEFEDVQVEQTYYWRVQATSACGDSGAVSEPFDFTAITTPILLTDLSAVLRPDGILLSWSVSADLDLLGFNIYRSESASGARVKINTDLIAFEWTRTAYEFLDQDPPIADTPTYHVRGIDRSGREEHLGQVTARAGFVPARGLVVAPNPFSEASSVIYTLPQNDHVRITVHDAGGRFVRLLLDQVKERGQHRIVWDGRDYEGRSMTSGVYHVTIECGADQVQRRVVLVR